MQINDFTNTITGKAASGSIADADQVAAGLAEKENAIAGAIDKLADRINAIADRVQEA